MSRLYYLGKPGDGYGWGVANTNLVNALKQYCDVVVDESTRSRFDAPVFVPIADSNLTPLRRVKAPRVLGYCFTEWPLTDNARHNAKQYDHIFAGSTWNTERLRAAGINQVSTLIQGVDHDRFKPLPPSQRKGFVVFSGGKYEFRKGQDIVLAAMRHFMAAHSDVVLLAAWVNQWKQSMESMKNSWLIDSQKPLDGLPADRVIMLPLIPNEQTPKIYEQAHIGLFPNRCEAGTNMVMTEFMACGRAVIASDAHGHKDVLVGDGPYRVTGGSYDPAGWFNANVSDVLWRLEQAYSDKDKLPERGQQCAAAVAGLTWDDCARRITAAIS